MNITTVLLCVLAILVLYLLYRKFQKTSTHPFFEMFDNTHPVIESLRMDLVKVHPRFATVKIIEGDQSYTLQKKKVFLCLKDKNTGQMYDKNMLTYVLLHEMAHVLNEKDIGHTPAFHKIFDELLEKAEKQGVYDPNLPLVEDYCPQ